MTIRSRANHCTLLVATVVATLAPAAHARSVRVFVVNPRIELRYADSYANYHDKMAALFDAAHPRRGALVQADVADVATRIQPLDPTAPTDVLVVFPEDVGLIAGLIGRRGSGARHATAAVGGSTAAFIALTVAYDPLIQYYQTRYPDLPGLRYLFLAETDTLYRAFYETFRELAQTYHVHIAASINVAPARRVDAATEPALVARLRDPEEPTREYAYEAISPQAVNTLFVFAPDGEVLVLDAAGNTVRSPSQTAGVLRGSLDKAYLTEVEQDPLGLAYGAVRDLGVLDTPVGRLGSVISKDAWMIDVNDRYDAKRANVIIQAEAFDTWGFLTDPWAPDGFKAGGFAQVQRNPNSLYNLTPCLIGNLFEVTFDGQGAIIGKRSKASVDATPVVPPASAWIGQNADSGFLAVAPWVRDDPGLVTPSLTLAQRRAQLVASGTKLLPLSAVACAASNAAGVCKNGYRESIISHDLDLPDAATPPARVPEPGGSTAFASSRAIDGPLAGEQRHPRVAARDGNVYVVWQDNRAGRDNIYLGISENAGETIAVVRVSDNPAGAVAELRPALALRSDGTQVLVTWQELCGDSDRACGRIKLARFDATGHKLAPDVRVDSGGDTAGKWNPAIALTRRGDPVVTWVDERDHGPEDIPLEHIYAAPSRDGGRTFLPSARVDAGEPVPSSASLDNKWAPTVATWGRWIYVLWTDFRNYNWDIYAAHSLHGLRFTANVRVDDAVGLERIHDHPAVAVDRHGALHAVWADRRAQDPVTAIRYARSDTRGQSFGPSQRVDAATYHFDPDHDTPNNQWQPTIAVSGDDLFVAWQDNRFGDNDIFVARSRNRGESFEVDERVDDSGSDPSNQYRPTLAVDEIAPGGRVLYVAWEDERRGPASITITRRLINQ
jgi:hypothetical protein